VPAPDFDDERDGRFKAYLIRFRPLAMVQPPIEMPGRRIRPHFVLAMAAAAAAILLVLTIFAHSRAGHPDRPEAVASAAGADDTCLHAPMNDYSGDHHEHDCYF